MSSSNCCFLTCIQISPGKSGGLVRSGGLVFPISFKNFPQFVLMCSVKHAQIIQINEHFYGLSYVEGMPY